MRNVRTYNNDNEELSFITLAAATANVTRYLTPDEKHDEDRERQTARDRAKKENAEREREYIEHRLRELRSWERRISGKKN